MKIWLSLIICLFFESSCKLVVQNDTNIDLELGAAFVSDQENSELLFWDYLKVPQKNSREMNVFFSDNRIFFRTVNKNILDLKLAKIVVSDETLYITENTIDLNEYVIIKCNEEELGKILKSDFTNVFHIQNISFSRYEVLILTLIFSFITYRALGT